MALLLGLPTAVRAETLIGKIVQFHAVAYNDPAAPFLETPEWQLYVYDILEMPDTGPEFDLGDVMVTGLYVAPAKIDIGADRIDITYLGLLGGRFAGTIFNGYIVEFRYNERRPDICVVIEGAAIDGGVTNVALSDAAVTVIPTGVSINLAGVEYDADSRIGIELTATACEGP